MQLSTYPNQQSAKSCKIRQRQWLLPLGLLLSVLLSMPQHVALGDKGIQTIQQVNHINYWQNWTALSQPRAPLHPQMVVAPDQTAYAVWEENGQIYYSRHFPGGSWMPTKVIATGNMPRIALDANGNPNVVFVNLFMGNFEIFHTRYLSGTWSLPRNISHTSGASYSPDISIGADGILYAVWTDTTPGYPCIYEARYIDGIWLNAPIMGSIGKTPAVAAGHDGLMHVVWQQKMLTNAYDIFHAALRNKLTTALPQDVSDTPRESLAADITVDYHDTVHVVWQEEVKSGFEIGYAFGRNGIWSWPFIISANNGRAEYPTVTTAHQGHLVAVGWDDGYRIWMRTQVAGSNAWHNANLIATSNWGNQELYLHGGNNNLYGIWVERSVADDADLHSGDEQIPPLFTYFYPR